MPGVIIREYAHADRQSIREISLATAMLGRPSHAFFDGDDVLADALTKYHTDYEPESCFVAELDGNVVGYVLSAKDTRRMDEIFSSRIFWPLLGKAICQGVFLSQKNWRLFGRILGWAFKGGYRIPDLYEEYPATLHINVLEAYRAMGVGEMLMERCFQYLGNAGIRGVRLATMSERAGEFFQKHAFRLSYASTRPYFLDVLHKKVCFRIYCKKIE